MFIDYYEKTYDEIEELAHNYRKNGYFEILNFLDIGQLWREICVQRKRGRKYFAVFNGKFIILEKDENITEDELYKFIIGKTKAEKEQADKEWLDEYQRKEREWNDKVPILIPVYTAGLKDVIDEKYHHLAEKYVSECLHSIYHEYLLESLIELLGFSKGKTFEEIQKKLYEQEHSGMSYSIVINLFKNLSDKGREYFEWQREKDQ